MPTLGRTNRKWRNSLGKNKLVVVVVVVLRRVFRKLVFALAPAQSPVWMPPGASFQVKEVN